ncbi:group III truncated hemoglobin [Roseobacter sp. YSTF-M11]|uniref:Group III truncated hemoglobin n=1 Tax=Roseobacter insulae TaxID=2859783 RepID=A0A9X1FV65_9RHOB|nr:group III truncated hemoglobin [Roseobacter insulae]MBW4707468.1 group III truncated hemoglobin [Roseobacter insulae]
MSMELLRHGELKRRQLQHGAAAIGITEEFITHVVADFYTRIRRHPVLGRIFDAQVGDNWDEHLATMRRFWCSVALNTGTYSGKPVIVHTALPQISPAHFDIWLGIFEQTLDARAPTTAAKEHMMIRAQRIARNLQLAIATRDGQQG